MSNTTSKPVHEIRLNRVKLAIWQNQGQNGAYFSVSVSRVFKKDDDWQRSDTLQAGDLLALAKAADLADSWIREQPRTPAA